MPARLVQPRIDFCMYMYTFRYMMNNPCDPWATDMVVVTTSKASHFGLREAQRSAFPSEALASEGVTRVFLVALEDDEGDGAVQSRLLEENARHGDLVQGNFRESYRNLAYKHVMGLQWAVQYCNAK